MDLVLGLSITSRGIRWVLVEGMTGEGAPVGSGVLDIPDVSTFDAEGFLEEALGDAVVHSAGLTASPEAELLAAKVRAAFSVVGGGARIVDVSDVTATEVLSRGIGELTGHDFVAVVLTEPGAALVATVDWQRVVVERIDRSGFAARVNGVSAVIGDIRPRPDAIFVVGSSDAETIARVLQDETGRPVVTAGAADFALTRGVALAAAQSVTVGGPDVRSRISRVRLLSSVLAAAVVVFVVSVSLAVGLRLTPKSDEPTRSTSAERHMAPIVEAAARPPIKAPVPPPPAAPPPAVPEAAPEAPAAVEHQVVAPVPEVAPRVEPEYVPPQAAPVAPEPVFVPPPAPVYVPPPPPPRLRDLIIDKIPLIRRLPH